MAKHLALHGDAAKDVAFEVEDCIGIYKVHLLYYWSFCHLKMADPLTVAHTS